jgi:two-component system nitrogen regulation response regulator NtrX
MERLSILTSGNSIGPSELALCGLGAAPLNSPKCDELFTENNYRIARSRFEREFICRKLEQCGASVSKTAELIGMERTHLYRKLKQLEIESEDN